MDFSNAGMREHYVCDTEVNLCYSNPCLNGGRCLRKEGGFTCQCPDGFAGDECQIDLSANSLSLAHGRRLCRSGVCPAVQLPGNCTGGPHYTPHTCQLKSRSFYRGSFLTFPALRQRYRLHLKLSFATRERNGLLLYNGRYNERNDFIALELVDGRLQFSFSLGANRTTVRLDRTASLADGQWHTVTVDYVNRVSSRLLSPVSLPLARRSSHYLLLDERRELSVSILMNDFLTRRQAERLTNEA